MKAVVRRHIDKLLLGAAVLAVLAATLVIARVAPDHPDQQWAFGAAWVVFAGSLVAVLMALAIVQRERDEASPLLDDDELPGSRAPLSGLPARKRLRADGMLAVGALLLVIGGAVEMIGLLLAAL